MGIKRKKARNAKVYDWAKGAPKAPHLGHEAAHLSGYPSHSLGKGLALQVAVGTAAGVGTYQINRKLAHVQHDTIAPPSPVTGGMPNNTGQNVSKVVDHAHKKITRKGGK